MNVNEIIHNDQYRLIAVAVFFIFLLFSLKSFVRFAIILLLAGVLIWHFWIS